MLKPRLDQEQQWSQNSAPRQMLPGWLISLILHAGLYALILFYVPRSGAPDGDNQPFQEVGLEIKGAAEAVAESTDQTTVEHSDSLSSTDPLLDAPPQPAEPPVPLQLPEIATVGPGVVVPQASASTGSALPSTAAARTPKTAGSPAVGANAGGGQRGQGGTTFLGLAAEGKSFLYLIDKSASMSQNNSIGVARAELMASLERLDSVQQYQIIFYDTEIHPMRDRDGKRQIFFATDVNRTWTRRHITSHVPGGGTLHKPALLHALSFAPDVIFFLSDGDTPALFTSDLEEITRKNRGRTQIYVIEFGEGAKISPGNWLEALARMNNGQYRYRDVLTNSKP